MLNHDLEVLGSFGQVILTGRLTMQKLKRRDKKAQTKWEKKTHPQDLLLPPSLPLVGRASDAVPPQEGGLGESISS